MGSLPSSLIPVDIRDSLFPTATHGTVRGSSLLHPVSLVRSYIGRIDLASYFSRLFEAILSPTLYNTGSRCARVKILCPLFVANYSGQSRCLVSLYHDSHPAFPAMRPHSLIVRLSCVKTFAVAYPDIHRLGDQCGAAGSCIRITADDLCPQLAFSSAPNVLYQNLQSSRFRVCHTFVLEFGILLFRL